MVWLGAGHKHAYEFQIELGILFSGLMTAAVVIAAGFLMSGVVVAEETSVTRRAKVTVPVSCSMTGSGETSHVASIQGGQYVQNIGTTVLKVFCNDNDGFAIYANGYTDDVDGKNVLTSAALGATHDINTGLATTGSTSSWAMKLTKTGDSGDVSTGNAFTIDSAPNTPGGATASFTNYHTVPMDFTKVAHKNAATNMNTTTGGATLETTYAVYASQTQAAGTYMGKVKYVLVHPADAVPNRKYTTAPGKIGYYPNGNGMVVDTMGDQTAGSNTEVVLWPSNFQRPSYGFAGWNDKFDMSGTNYGPMESITTPDLTSGGLSLYANWVKSAGTMQNWTGCSSMSIGDVTALTDARDNNTYAVAKLADGKCWMIENLRLENTNSDNSTGALAQGYHSSFVGLAGPETANFTSSITANSLYSTDGSNGTTAITGSYQTSRFPRYRNDNTSSTIANMTTPTDANIYSYGNYYTWAAVIADTTHYSTNNQSATGTSICPAGWHLPTGGTTTASEFGALSNAMGGYKNESGVAQTMNSSTTPTGAEMSKTLRSYPSNFLYSGYVYASSVYSRGSYGYYWSSTASSNGYSCPLHLDSFSVIPGMGTLDKSSGLTARCLIGS